MVFGNVISIRKAEPDSQFRLLNCPVCGSSNVAYVEYKSGNQEPWRVDCFDCGHSVDGKTATRHDAQVAWNQEAKRRWEQPCKDCPDRHTACSDHCTKPAFVEKNRRNEARKAAQRREGQIWGYTGDQIRKNRRIK